MNTRYIIIGVIMIICGFDNCLYTINVASVQLRIAVKLSMIWILMKKEVYTQFKISKFHF